jgi:hypothetical protein
LRRRAAADIVAVANGQSMIGRTRRHQPHISVQILMGASVNMKVVERPILEEYDRP